jgi:beta-lactamase superfamily II metal-dependent hydrolase
MESTPPKLDEFEISIFGPGRGECIVVHLGDNQWCVVDSCIARGDKDSVAVKYLKSFNNDALGNVQLVVASHWHDDHIGGMASLFSQTPQADFCCSMALQYSEFVTLISAASQNIAGRSGVEEFRQILDELDKRGVRSPIFAVENKPLFTRPIAGTSFPITLESLSPSDPTIRLALSQIKGFLPTVNEPQRRIPNRTPNTTSVVIWIKAGPIRALLGADLENTVQADQGWSAVLSCHQDTSPGHMIKIPHHASMTSDNTDVWHQMLEANPLAVVTPFAGGRTRLPSDSDLQRLLARTMHLYCTTMGSGKPPTRDRSVDRLMKQQTSKRRVVDGQPGHVRIRWSISEKPLKPQIETFSGAYHVK